MASKYAFKLLTKENVKDEKPHEKGWKVDKFQRPLLQGIYDVLRAGYTTKSGKPAMYDDLAHSLRKSSHCRQLVEALKIKHVRNVWLVLRREHPSLYKATLSRRRERRAELSRVCCLRILSAAHCNFLAVV